MPDSVHPTVEVSRKLKGRLLALAYKTRRSESEIAEEALSAYLEWDDHYVMLIRQRLEAAEAGGPFVDHGQVLGVLRSRRRAKGRARSTKRPSK